VCKMGHSRTKPEITLREKSGFCQLWRRLISCNPPKYLGLCLLTQAARVTLRVSLRVGQDQEHRSVYSMISPTLITAPPREISIGTDAFWGWCSVSVQWGCADGVASQVWPRTGRNACECSAARLLLLIEATGHHATPFPRPEVSTCRFAAAAAGAPPPHPLPLRDPCLPLILRQDAAASADRLGFRALAAHVSARPTLADNDPCAGGTVAAGAAARRCHGVTLPGAGQPGRSQRRGPYRRDAIPGREGQHAGGWCPPTRRVLHG